MPISHLMLLLLANVAWGFNFVAAAAAVQEFPPLVFTMLRFAAVLLLVLPLMRLPQRDQWRRLLAVALCNGCFHFGFSFWALSIAEQVSGIAIAIQVYIPMATLMAVVLLGERIGWRSIAAIAIAFTGVVVVGYDPAMLADPLALILVLCSAFFLALGTILMKGLRGLTPFNFQGWTAVISIPVLLLMSVWLEVDQWQRVSQASALAWGATLYSAVAASIIGHGIIFYLIQRHPVSLITPYLLLTPVLGVCFGVWVWGDRLGPNLITGGALVLSGVLMITLRARRKARIPAPPDPL